MAVDVVWADGEWRRATAEELDRLYWRAWAEMWRENALDAINDAVARHPLSAYLDQFGDA